MKNKKLLLAFLPAFLLASCGATSDASHYVNATSTIENRLYTSKSSVSSLLKQLSSATLEKQGKEITSKSAEEYDILAVSFNVPSANNGVSFTKSKFNSGEGKLELTFKIKADYQETIEEKEYHTFVTLYKKDTFTDYSSCVCTLKWNSGATSTVEFAL